MAEQVAAVDPERLGPLVGHLTKREMTDVDEAIRVVLRLDRPAGRVRPPR
ncbi:type II toxin-antitoxin system PemK/MazF family toxin [Luedemannella helvata]